MLASVRCRSQALHEASEAGYKTIVSILLAQGANPYKRDKMGNVALHLARTRGYPTVQEKLEEAMKNQLTGTRQVQPPKAHLFC